MAIANREFTFGVIGGYGAIGSVVVAELARRRAGSILVGGRDRSRADALAAQFDLASAAFVDVHNAAALDAFCASAAIVVNCGGPVVEAGTRAAEAAFRRGCHFVDPGAGPTIDVMAPHQDEMRRQELSFVLAAGWIPGLSEVLAHHADRLAQAHLDDPGMMRLYLADSSDWSETGFRDIAWHARHRMIPGFRSVRNGRLGLPSPRDVTRVVDLPPPLGRQRVYLYLGREVEAFARRRRAGFTGYVTNVSPRTLATFGLVALGRFLPDRVAAAWLRAAFRHDYATRSKHGCVGVRVEDRAPASRRRLTLAFSTLRNRWLTGLVPALVAAMLAEGQPVERGAHFLGEAVDSGILLERLAESGQWSEATVDERER